MLKYTLCFIRNGEDLLMLYRKYPPNVACYNGVGGKIKEGESPLRCVLREVEEETGIRFLSPRFSGIVTWGPAIMTEDGGMYIYVAELPAGINPASIAPKDTEEGMLEWLPIDYCISTESSVVDNIPEFLPPMLAGKPPDKYHCEYQNGRLQSVTVSVLNWDTRRLAST